MGHNVLVENTLQAAALCPEAKLFLDCCAGKDGDKMVTPAIPEHYMSSGADGETATTQRLISKVVSLEMSGKETKEVWPLRPAIYFDIVADRPAHSWLPSNPLSLCPPPTCAKPSISTKSANQPLRELWRSER